MSKIADPGKDLPREQAKAERLKAWKRPTTKAKREQAKNERIAQWEAKYGGAGSTQPNYS